MIYLLSILFTLCFVFYSKYQFQDLKNTRNTKWKTWGVLMRTLFFISTFLLQLFPNSWQDYLLAGSINILLFEIGINVIALNAPVFWKGYSGKLDIYLGNKKWFLIFALILTSLIIKIIT